jgi:hypothetical protein
MCPGQAVAKGLPQVWLTRTFLGTNDFKFSGEDVVPSHTYKVPFAGRIVEQRIGHGYSTYARKALLDVDRGHPGLEPLEPSTAEYPNILDAPVTRAQRQEFLKETWEPVLL